MLEFNKFSLILVIVTTLAGYLLACNKFTAKQKVFLACSYLFIFLYSGIGGALTEANPTYLVFYIIYLFVMSLAIRFARVGIDFHSYTHSFESFIDKYSKRIIILYFLIIIIGFLYPEYTLSNIVHPPSPSLEDFDFTKEGDNYGGGLVASLIYLASNIVMPFFYFALYHFRDKSKKVVLILLLLLYLTYCKSGYVGRGTILQTLIICFFAVFYNLNKQQQKRMIIGVICLMPFLLFGFYYYSFVRLGRSFESISVMNAIQVLFGQEISYPLHYNDYINKSGGYFADYLLWLILLPFPGFMKFGLGNFMLNQEFSMTILGVDVSDSTFFVVLPGVVGESIYVFGPRLFFLHAIILGLVIKFVIKTFTSNDCFRYIYYLCIVQFSFMLGRAGTVSVYPSMFKSFLILIIACLFIRGSKIHTSV